MLIHYVEVAYIFKYPEEKDVSDDPKKDPWSIRQTGVYQRYEIKSQQSTWILLHPVKDSIAHTRLTTSLNSMSNCAELHRHPLQLHNFLISTYLRKWRDYMLYYEKQLLPLVRLPPYYSERGAEIYMNLANIHSPTQQ